MKTKRKTGKFLSLVLSFVLAIGILPVVPGGVTAKAEIISDVAVTIDLPEAEERISACGTPTFTSDLYTVEVYKWLKGSYETAADVNTAIGDESNILTDTDTLEEKQSYTVLFQATTYGAAGNQFGESMTLTVNGYNALFVNKKSYSFGNQANVVIFAYSFTVPEIVEYNLKIGGIKVKSNNLVIDQKDTPTITSGSFVFDPSTYTLTMDHVVASGDFGNYFLQYSGEDDLTIQVVGTNTVTFTADGWQGIRSDGKGNLRITSESDGELLIKGTALKTGIYFYNDLVLGGSLKLTCDISSYDSAIGLMCDSGGTLTVEDGVNLFVYTKVDENASSPVSQGIRAKVVMNGGNVNIESYGAVSNSVFGIGTYTEIYGGILSVACECRAIYGSISFNYPGAKPKITASTNFDGTNPVTYNSSNHSSYKYIKVEKGDPKIAIDSLTLDTLYKPVAGEMPAYPAFSDGTDNIYYDWNWYVWNTEAGTWDPFYDEEEEDSVGDSVFREGEKYALKLFVKPKKSAYTFPSTMTVVHNEMNIPNYDESNPNVTYKKISSSGSSLELFITGDDMPVSTKNPVNSAEITINGFHHGKNVEDITVTLDAAGADFYKDAETLPNGWYLAIDNDCDGEVDGFAAGALQVEADYYLAAGMKAKEGYRVSSLTKEKITLNDGTASIGEIMMCNASADMAEIVYKLPKLNYNIVSVPVQPATMEADGQKTHYQCSECHEKFLDAAGSQPATEESLTIPKVASVAFPQSEYDYTTEFAAKGWAKHIVVKDSDGKQLTIGTDYSVKQIGENLFGVCSAKVTGKGTYNFEKTISCTVHPSSTLRFPDDINKLNHGSYAINLYNNTKTCVINGDERIMSYGSLAALIEVDKKIDTPSEKTFDLDKDGSADLKVEMDLTSVCEGGAPISFEVLSTCSVKENKTFTLSDYAEEFLKNTLSVPYYDNITFHFVYPCASGHSYGDAWNKDATGHWRVCSVCGKTETVAEHTYDEGVVTKAATCKEDGEKTCTCSTCGQTKTETVYKHDNHTFDDGKVTTPATEKEKGVKTYTCTVCGQTKTESIPETGKKEEATPGTGDAGGETPGETPGTEIKDESGNGEYVVTTDPAAPGEGGDAAAPTVEYKAPADTSEQTVTVPATIEAGGVTYQVTAIADNAFKNNKNLTTVKIDNNVVTIGKNAFYGCKNLKKVTIGDGVTTIGSGAFSGCSKLKTLTIGKNVATIGDKAFYKCTSLTKVTIPAKVSKIGKQAFYGCKKLKSITIKTTKLTSKKVAKNAFGKNAKKVTVTLPKLKKSKKTAYAKMLKTKGLKKAKFK